MFWRFGAFEESRPVAATAWSYRVWMRPSAAMHAGSASTYVPLSFEISRHSRTRDGTGPDESAWSSSRTSEPVAYDFVFAVFLTAG